MTWEVDAAVAAAGARDLSTAIRASRRSTSTSAGVDALMPGFKKMHPMGARLPQECVAHHGARLREHDLPDQPSRPDATRRGSNGADLRWVYASHRRQLQYLQWRCPAEALGAQVARAPLVPRCAARRVSRRAASCRRIATRSRSIASLASLVTVLREHVERRRSIRSSRRAEWTERLAARARSARWRCAKRAAGRRALFDLHFAEFIRDRSAWCAASTTHFGLTLDRRRRGAHARASSPPTRRTSTARTATRSSAAGLDAGAERRRYARLPGALRDRVRARRLTSRTSDSRRVTRVARAGTRPAASGRRRDLVGGRRARSSSARPGSRCATTTRNEPSGSRRRLGAVQRDPVVAVVERLHVAIPELHAPVGAARRAALDHQRLVGLEAEGAERVDVVGRAPARHVGAPRHRRADDVRGQGRERDD